MKKTVFFKSLVFAILSIVSLQSFAQGKPNVLFILTDDQGYGDFSCMGNPYVKTPAMDQIKNDGVFLSNFHVSAVCAPTRAALMTGRYNYRTGVSGVNQGRVNMHADEHTIAEYFKDAGYDTGLFGKWHLGYNYPMRATDQGFDVAYTWDEMQRFRTDPLMEENNKLKEYKGEFLTDVIFDKAEEYITKKATDEKPFFAYVATYLPHTHPDGSQVPDEYMHRFDQYEELNWHTRQCYAMIEKVDERIAKLLQKLHELKIADETIIVFTTDNGSAQCYPGSKRIAQKRYKCGFKGMKGDPFEGGIRVPLFIKWSDHFDPNLQIDECVAHVDILPTLMDMIGEKCKDEKVIDGRSFHPLLKKEKIDWHNEYFHHLYLGNEEINDNKWSKAVLIKDEYKLVEGKYIYNIEQDPYELHDLSATLPDKKNEMRKLFLEKFTELKNERNFEGEVNIVGTKKQKLTTLFYMEKIIKEAGWKVNVVNSGPYTLTIHDIQHSELKEGSKFVLKAKDKEWKIDIIDKNTISLENIKLPLGEYIIKLDVEGDTVPKFYKHWDDKLGRYHRFEWGHRRVTLKKQ